VENVVNASSQSQTLVVLKNYLLSGLILLTLDIRIYRTHIYRIYFVNDMRKLVENFSLTIKFDYFSLGNDV